MTQLPFDDIFRNKKVLITGNTGFKGSWLSLWLTILKAEVHGYALSPPTSPSLFNLMELDKMVSQQEADIRDFDRLKSAIKKIQPDIIFHLAAQSLVRESYANPMETFQINTLGTLNVMEAVRQAGLPVAIVMITSDKCYENKEWLHGYRESDPLGGYDPYSSSKGAAEILINSWRNSFFNINTLDKHGVRMASARAGNVIGGGDWAADRIVPDCIRDLLHDGVIGVRNPKATRPWQHVLDPLHGYLQLGAKLLDTSNSDIEEFCSAFNFGPLISSNRRVEELVDKIVQYWEDGTWKWISPEVVHHEASLLNLSTDKTYHKLEWLPRWDFDATIRHTMEWYVHWKEGAPRLLDFTMGQINDYEQYAHREFKINVLQKEIQPQL